MDVTSAGDILKKKFEKHLKVEEDVARACMLTTFVKKNIAHSNACLVGIVDPLGKESKSFTIKFTIEDFKGFNVDLINVIRTIPVHIYVETFTFSFTDKGIILQICVEKFHKNAPTHSSAKTYTDKEFVCGMYVLPEINIKNYLPSVDDEINKAVEDTASYVNNRSTTQFQPFYDVLIHKAETHDFSLIITNITDIELFWIKKLVGLVPNISSVVINDQCELVFKYKSDDRELDDNVRKVKRQKTE